MRLVRSMISRVAQDPRTNNLELNYVGEDGRLQTEEFDLVVLSVGLSPHPATKQLAQVCGIATNKWGFVENPPLKMVETSREGIFTCGVYQSPKDIPETVGQASAAAGAAATLLSQARGTLLSKAEYPQERDIPREEPRIGVFVCHCGINIAGVVDVAQVSDYARTLPRVVYADHYTFTCATDSLEEMRKVIETEGLNRVVVASYSPRTHEALFQDNLRKAGLNKYLFEMANIRDQDSWVHQNNPDLATEKAKELVKMAVARAAVLEPLTEMLVPVNQRALVVGGGLAGLVAALTIADAGYRVYLPDLQERFGGALARDMRYTLEGHAIQPLMRQLVTRRQTHPNIRWWEEARITGFSGHLGNFQCDLESPRGKWSVRFGAVVIATGGQECEPKEYLYGDDTRILTQIELEGLWADSPEELGATTAIVMIQCVGSREPEHPYCSRVCCAYGLRLARLVRHRWPECEVTTFYMDLQNVGHDPENFQEACGREVNLIRALPGNAAVTADGSLWLRYLDEASGRPLATEVDLLVLAVGIAPGPDTPRLAEMLDLELTREGFLKPGEAINVNETSGIFLAGTAAGPKGILECIAEAPQSARQVRKYLKERA